MCLSIREVIELIMSYLFDYYSKVYDVFMKKMHLDSNSYILGEIQEEHKAILDVGGGTGTLADILINRDKEVTILDPSVSMTKIAKKKNSKIKIVNSCFEDYAAKRKYDGIILRDCLHHMKNQKYVIMKCLDLLKSNGIIIIQDFQPYKMKSKLLFLFERCCFEKIKPIKSKELRNILRLGGAKVKVRNIDSYQYVVVGRVM